MISENDDEKMKKTNEIKAHNAIVRSIVSLGLK